MQEKGIKYSPDFDFSEEYYLLKELNHIQIPVAYDFGQDELFRDAKSYPQFSHIQNISFAVVFVFFSKHLKHFLGYNLKRLIQIFRISHEVIISKML